MTAMCLIVVREPEPIRFTVTVVDEPHPVASVMLPARPGATAPTVTAGADPAPPYDRFTVTVFALAMLNPVTVTLVTRLDSMKLVPAPYLVQLPKEPPQSLGP